MIILRTKAPMAVVAEAVPDKFIWKMTIYPCSGRVDIYFRSLVTVGDIYAMKNTFINYDEESIVIDRKPTNDDLL